MLCVGSFLLTAVNLFSKHFSAMTFFFFQAKIRIYGVHSLLTWTEIRWTKISCQALKAVAVKQLGERYYPRLALKTCIWSQCFWHQEFSYESPRKLPNATMVKLHAETEASYRRGEQHCPWICLRPCCYPSSGFRSGRSEKNKTKLFFLLLLFIKSFQDFNIALLKCPSYMFSLFILYVRSLHQLLDILHRKTEEKKQLWVWVPLSSVLELSPYLAKILTVLFH